MEMSAEQRKEYIILTAIDLIHENGINNVSTKEIARRLGISEGLVFKLFPKKNDLIMAVIDKFSFYDKDIFNTAIDKGDDAREAILFYINSFLIYYENYPAITAVFQIYDTLKGNSELEIRSKSIFLQRLEYMTMLIRKAQETGRIDDILDPETLADILTSTIRGICLKWRLTDFHFSLREKALYAVNIILDAIIVTKI